MFKESRIRSLIKGLIWRIFALLNSWIISWIVLGILGCSSFFVSALLMNVTGLIIFYIYERIWNKINNGKYIE